MPTAWMRTSVTMPKYKHPLGGPPGKVVGYCRYHKCTITVPQLRQRECLRKECWALKKQAHPYWEQRDVSREKRAARKKKQQAVMHSLKGGSWK